MDAGRNPESTHRNRLKKPLAGQAPDESYGEIWEILFSSTAQKTLGARARFLGFTSPPSFSRKFVMQQKSANTSEMDNFE